MAKRDKRLYRSLRTAGVRKSAARTASEAAESGGEGARRVLSAVAQELHEAGDLLEARAGGAAEAADETERADPDRHLREAARKTAAKRV